MKKILFCFVFVTLIFCQHPVPAPELETPAFFSGLWWLEWLFSQTGTNENCTSSTMIINNTITMMNQDTTTNWTCTYDIGTPNTVWNQASSSRCLPAVVLAYDPLRYSWFVLGSAEGYGEFVELWTRSQKPMSSSMIKAIQGFAAAEGYYSGPDNSTKYDNSGCPEPSIRNLLTE